MTASRRGARHLGVIVVAASLTVGVIAQEPEEFVRDVYPFPVFDQDGNPYAHPALGGLNIPRPQLLDIDGDGDLDLFVQEYSGAVMFFEQVGEPGAPQYVWREDRYQGTEVGEWYHFADMDADGDLDLLGEEMFSKIRYYQNVGSATDPVFELLTATLLDNEGELMFSDRQNIPKIADLDCDGALDLLVGRVEGTITRFEMSGSDDKGAPVFRFVEDRFQNIEIIGQVLGGSPASLQQQPSGPSAELMPSEARTENRGTLHGANTMAMVDYDDDGDLDLFWGDFFEPGVLLIENNGSCRNVSMRGEPTPFPRRDPVATSGYNAPAFGDYDGDGDRDMLMGVLGGAFNPNNTSVDNFLLLEGSGGTGFSLETRQFLTQIDAGSESLPDWVDIDADGDLDLFLANKIEPGDTQAGRLFFFENDGSPTAPELHARGPVAGFDQAYHYSPAFGDYDMVLGTWDDELLFVENVGTAVAPAWAGPTSGVATLTRGRNAQPALGDVDGDGDLDLFIGESSGEMNFYRNVGTAETASFELVDDKFLTIDVGRRSSPHLNDVDADGDLDLVIGSETEGIYVAWNTGTATSPSFEAPSEFLSAVSPFASPFLADVDGDGESEIYTGTVGGGLAVFRAKR